MLEPARLPVRRFLFWLSYDGSRFPEMARGGTGFGVMDLLEQVLIDSLFGSRSSVSDDRHLLRSSPSSRTDSGVHALRNAVISQLPLRMDRLDNSIDEKVNHIKAWNYSLESAVSGGMKILDFHRVSPGFCVRRNVSYRKYTYRLAVAKSWEIWNSVKATPSTVCFSERSYAWLLPPGLEPSSIERAGHMFEGEQVMGSFFKHTAREKRSEPIPPSTIRNILHVGITKGDAIAISNDIYDYYNITIVARSFVREQIRRMMSCLVFNAYGRLKTKDIKWLLQNPISSNFFDIRLPIAPPTGLFLTDVIYAPEMFDNPVPYHQHSWDYDSQSTTTSDSLLSSSNV